MAHRKTSKRSKAKTMVRLADLEQSKNTRVKCGQIGQVGHGQTAKEPNQCLLRQPLALRSNPHWISSAILSYVSKSPVSVSG